MSILVDIVCATFLLSGAFFVIVGGVGIVRLPDFYTRLHAGGITDTLGAALILLGLAFKAGLTLATIKLAMIGALLYVTSPTACHALAQAARTNGLEPKHLSMPPHDATKKKNDQ